MNSFEATAIHAVLELQAVSYCPEQDTFHVETLAEHIKKNKRNALGEGRGKGFSFMLVGLHPSREEAHKICNEIRNKQDATAAKKETSAL